MKKILKNVLFQILTFIITIGTIGMTYAAWTTLSSTQGATGQPVNQALIQGIINNLNDLNTRLTALENTASINGVCNNTIQYACTAGSTSSNIAGSCGGSSTWSCLGSGGGTNASCTKANAACAVNGSCGGSNNTCSTGSPSGYSAGSCGGSSSWSCLGSGGGSNASCGLANAACAVNGSCGGSNNTCSTGSPSGYSAGSCGGSSSWSCLGSGGGSSASCGIANAACGVNGSCGGSNNTCSTGSPSGYSAGSCGGSSSWSCLGSGGGSSASCGIANAACAINGSCGGSASTCSAGSPSGYSAGSCGGSKTWSCLGSGGGTNASCSLANAACPPPPWVGTFKVGSTTLTMTQTSATIDHNEHICILEKSTMERVSGYYNLANKSCYNGTYYYDAIDFIPYAAWINYYGTTYTWYKGGSASIAGNGSWSGNVPFDASHTSSMLMNVRIINNVPYTTTQLYNNIVNRAPTNGTIIINSATYSAGTDTYTLNYTTPLGMIKTMVLTRQ